MSRLCHPKYNLKFSNNFSRATVNGWEKWSESVTSRCARLAKLLSIYGVSLRFRIFYMQQIDIAAKTPVDLSVRAVSGCFLLALHRVVTAIWFDGVCCYFFFFSFAR